ncbi:MAG: nidogen-like domain-containing protein [Limisphaerales bacterium]
MANLPFSIKFYGTTYSEFYVNNNGNITFDTDFGGSGFYTPDTTLTSLGKNIVAPFWADVDTRDVGSDVVRYGTGTIGGRTAFGANWVNVGYFDTHSDKLLSVQLILIDRSDIAGGDFDMEFNYCKVRWEAGDVSGGSDGFWNGQPTGHFGGPARVGFASAGGAGFQMNGSGVPGAFLDSNLNTGLIYNSFNSSSSGRYFFQFRNGIPLQTP